MTAQAPTMAMPNLQDLHTQRDCQILSAEKRTQSSVEAVKAGACVVATFATAIFSMIFFMEFAEELIWAFSSCSLLTLGLIQAVSFAAVVYFASEMIQRFGNASILSNHADFIEIRQKELATPQLS